MFPHRENSRRLSTFFAVFAISMVLTVETRYLRPSDHGIDYQNNPTDVNSPEVMSFFDGASAELPEAKNSSEPQGRNTGAPATFQRRDDRRGKDGVREALLIASLACGFVGVALMVGAAFLYFLQRRRSSSPNSCKQIVVRASS